MSKLYFFILIIILIFSAVSCASAPAAEVEEISVVTVQEEQEEEIFDPDNVSADYYDLVMREVRAFMENYSGIISRADYNAWVSTLSPEYFRELSSEETLRRASESPAMVSRRITLRTPQDYFTHIVVPARTNSRVDVIEFIDNNRVKAFTVNTNRAGEEISRIRLFDLEKVGNSWYIIN